MNPALAPDGASALLERIRKAVSEVVIGRPVVVDRALTCLAAGGHLLIEDVPGVGKTTLAASLAHAVGAGFRRIQFTSDLLPGDVLGMRLPEPGTHQFKFHPGPVFAHVVLADELNRTSPRTQSAFLEAMEEGKVTIDGETHDLPSPFWVVATQNPHDAQGAYGLPDSQLDRFLIRTSVGYPDREQERVLLRRESSRSVLPQPVACPDDLRSLQMAVSRVALVAKLEDRILDLVQRTRQDPRFIRGVSPRGAQSFARALRAYALVRGRDFVIPEDVFELAGPVLSHRVLVRGETREGSLRVIQALVEAG